MFAEGDLIRAGGTLKLFICIRYENGETGGSHSHVQQMKRANTRRYELIVLEDEVVDARGRRSGRTEDGGGFSVAQSPQPVPFKIVELSSIHTPLV